MKLPGDQYAFVNTKSLMEMVDSILSYLCCEQDLVSFSANEILDRQDGLIKPIYQ